MQFKTLFSPQKRNKLIVFHFSMAALYIGIAIFSQLINNNIYEKTPDFLAYYTAGGIASDHGNLYEPESFKSRQLSIIKRDVAITELNKYLAFINPPQTAFLFIPLSLFSYLAAFTIWLSCNLLFSLLIARELYRRVNKLEKKETLFFISVAFGTFPWGLTLMQGQITIIMCWALLRFISELENGNWWKAALYTLPFTFKPHLFALILIPIAVAGYWRLIGWCIVVAIATILLATSYFGISVWSDYVHFLSQIMTADEAYGASTAAMMNLRGIATLLFGKQPLLFSIVSYLLAAAFVFFLCKKLQGQRTVMLHAGIAFALITAMLMGPWLHGHDVYLLLPALLLLLEVTGQLRFKLFAAFLYAVILLATLFQPLQQIAAFFAQLVMLGWIAKFLRDSQSL